MNFVELFYSKEIRNTIIKFNVNQLKDQLSGTVDTNVQLINSSGELVAGAFYKDGLTTSQTPEAVANDNVYLRSVAA